MKALTFNLPNNVIDGLKVFDGAVKQRVKAELVAGNRFAVRLVDQSKSRDQEEKYHAMIAEIASQHQPGGRQLGEETMKRLLVDQFKADTLQDPELKDDWRQFGDVEMMPSLDGQRVVVLGTQTRHFPKRIATAFISWLYAFGDETGVVFTEKVLDPQTGQIVLARRAPKGVAS